MKKYIILLLTTSILLSACNSIAYLRLMHIRMGMSIDKVVGVLESDDDGKGVYIINNYENDTFDISRRITNPDGKINILITQKYYPVQSEDPYYLFAFIDQKLIYWGLPMEFNANDSKLLNDIGIIAAEIIEKEYLD